ncbi:hypothetical protein E2C01_030050 [Portunus trituberculatus]|uniref:Uncharacterized protein n=1 Tax=Portunus trituberculatus TaxID=210409 RepID=A0A5B7ETP0_PORTR|nr:hypothetical protein [Portunus trituberculatus]
MVHRGNCLCSAALYSQEARTRSPKPATAPGRTREGRHPLTTWMTWSRQKRCQPIAHSNMSGCIGPRWPAFITKCRDTG